MMECYSAIRMTIDMSIINECQNHAASKSDLSLHWEHCPATASFAENAHLSQTCLHPLPGQEYRSAAELTTICSSAEMTRVTGK